MSSEACSTEMLVRNAQRGVQEDLDRLIAYHLDDLRAFVRLQIEPSLRVRESRSDVVQSVCRNVLEGLSGFEYRGEGSFRAWLFTAAFNKVRQKREFHRALRRDVGRDVALQEAGDDGTRVTGPLYASLCSLEPSPSQNAIAQEETGRIERAMDALSPEHRDVLLLSRIVGLSNREIARRLGRTESAVRALLGRATVRLLAALEGRGA